MKEENVIEINYIPLCRETGKNSCNIRTTKKMSCYFYIANICNYILWREKPQTRYRFLQR